jgi:hypothetical protein
VDHGCEKVQPSYVARLAGAASTLDKRAERHRLPLSTTGAFMNDPVQKVSVSDVSMPFGSMVVFILKWTLASIPAMLIIVLIGLVIAAIFGGLFTALQSGSTV